jgi:subtilisin family serine protease
MRQHGRHPARRLAIQRFIGGSEHPLGAGSTSLRRGRGARCLPGIDELETRTLLSLPAVTGPMPAPSPLTATATATAIAQTTFNLQFQPGSARALSQLMPLIAAEGATVAPTTIPGLYTVRASAATITQLEQSLSTNPAVAYADPVHMFQILTAPNDPDYVNGDQWQLNGTWGVNAPATWSVTTGSDGVIVADVDTGLNVNLPDIYDNVWLNQPEIPASVRGNLTDVYNDGVITFSDLNNPINQGSGKIVDTNGDGIITGGDVLASTSAGGWVNPSAPSTQDGDTSDPDDLIGWNFVNDTNNPSDGNGHGTFTAGEIAEMTNNGTGGAGLVWNTQLMPVEFIDASGSGTDTAAAQSIDYAVNHGAKVINASWGGNGIDPTIAAAIQYADQNGVIIVAAAGNNGTNDDTSFFSPASYSSQYANVISVAAIASDGTLASFSNYGTGSVQLAAPGVSVFSTNSSGGFSTDSGTSMAAPMVTGTVALVEAAHPSWSMSQVIDAVLDTVTPDPYLSGMVSTDGVVNAGAAVANTDGPCVVSATPDGSINSSVGLSTVQLTFNEEINPATLTSAQVTLTGPGGVIPANEVSVTPVAGSNDHEFAVSFPKQTAAGAYTLKVGPDFQDWYGNDMNQNRNSRNGEAGDAFTEIIRLTGPGSTDLLSIAGVPTVTPAGTSETFTVTALSPNGGTDTGYVGTIAFTSTDPHASLPANFAFTAADNGTQTFTVTFRTAGSQSITATDTSNPAIIGTEENVTVTSASAQSLKVTGFPTTAPAGIPETFTVTAIDAYGNIATGYFGTVQFTSSDSQAVLPAGSTMTPEDQGTFTFTATLETLGTQSITATDTTTSSLKGTESGINVVAPVPSFKVTGFSTLDTAGASGTITVTAFTASGNVDTGYVGTVNLTRSDPRAVITPSSYTFTGTDAGAHSFSVILDSAGTQSITATDTVNANMTGGETGIIVQAAAARSLSIAGYPASDTAGVAHGITVTALDPYGNVATGYVGTLAFSSSDGRAVLPAHYTFTAADAGTHTFPVTLETAGTQSITATDTVNANLTAGENSITVQAAQATRLAVTGFPTPDTAGTSVGVTVTAYDAFGNVATGYAGTLALSSSDAAAVLPPDHTFTVANAGTYSFLVTLETAGTQSITATDTTTPSLTGAESNIIVNPAAASTLSIAGFPTTDTAGNAHTVSVTAFDAYGNVATGYVGTVAFSSSDGRAVMPPEYTFTSTDAGKHAFSVSLVTASTQSITATDTVTPSLTVSENGIAVQASTATTLAVAGYPATDTAGTSRSVTVTAYDAYGNVATGYLGTVTLSSSDGHAVLPLAHTFTAADAGTHSFSVTLDTAGTQSIAATDSVTASITGSETGISVHPASAQSLSVTGFPATETAGAASSVIVTAHDAFGNVATGYAGTVAVTSSEGHAVLPASFTFTAGDAGTHSFSVTLRSAGAQSITALDLANNTVTGTQSGIVVNPAAASVLVLSGYPSMTSAGADQTFTVTAQDPFGNIAASYLGTIHFRSSDGQDAAGSGLPLSYTFTTGAGQDNGVHTFSAVFKTAGTQSITALDAVTHSITGTESGIVVSPAAASHLLFGQQPTATSAGAAIGPAVIVDVVDAYGNVIPTDSSTVSLTLTGAAFEGGSNTATVAASNGVATFNGLKIDLAGSYTASGTDGALIPTGASNTFAIRPAAAALLVIEIEPSATATAGQAFGAQPVIVEEDRFGNRETGDDTSEISASASNGSAALQGTTVATFSSGVATFTNLAEDTAGTVSVTFKSGSLVPVTSNSIQVNAASATRLVITTPPPEPLVAGQPFTLVVASEDPYGNVVPTYSGNVTISLPSDPGFTATGAAKNGVATFTELTLPASADTETVRAVATGLNAAQTSPLSITAVGPTPTIISEHVVTLPRKSRKGKPVFVGFALEYSGAMDPASAGLAANYAVDLTSRKHVKRKLETVLKPVAFSSAYDSSTNTVTLTIIQGKKQFAQGGQISVIASRPDGVASAAWVPLSASDTLFTISAQAKRITLD